MAAAALENPSAGPPQPEPVALQARREPRNPTLPLALAAGEYPRRNSAARAAPSLPTPAKDLIASIEIVLGAWMQSYIPPNSMQ